MKRKRKKYTPQFIHSVLTGAGKAGSITTFLKEMNVSYSNYANWKKKYGLTTQLLDGRPAISEVEYEDPGAPDLKYIELIFSAGDPVLNHTVAQVRLACNWIEKHMLNKSNVKR